MIGDGKRPLFGRAARDEVFWATAAQLLILKLPSWSATRPRRGVFDGFGIKGTCFVAWVRQITAALAGLDLLADGTRSVRATLSRPHTECACYFRQPHTECAGYDLVSGSLPRALPKRGRTMPDRSCAADIRVPASG